LHVEHEQPLEEYETLYHAHSVNSLQIVCNDCALREY
jgi:predicted HNH restriction endonuclease